MMRISPYVAVLLATLAAACGPSDTGGGGAPHGSTITFAPSEITVEMDVSAPAVDRTSPVLVTVRNSAGNPVKDARVELFFEFLLLDEALIPQPNPFITTTDDFGNIRFYAEYPIGGGADYLVTIQAFSGSAFAVLELTVSCDGC